jgi:hypothetical protein
MVDGEQALTGARNCLGAELPHPTLVLRVSGLVILLAASCSWIIRMMTLSALHDQVTTGPFFRLQFQLRSCWDRQYITTAVSHEVKW